ncbi:MAG: ABC transporter permease [Deinococcales bacterium]
MESWDSWLISTFARALAFSTPLLWAALGEIYAERSGVVNLGVEGMMIIAAIIAFATAFGTGSILLALTLAALVAGLAALLHAFISITLQGNQYISGLALTILGLGLAGLIGRGYEGKPLKNPMESIDVPLLADIPILGPALFQDQHLLTYLGLIVAVILWFVLYKSRLGLVLRSVGENPKAADSAGINVSLVRYGAVIFGGIMAGVAGAFLSLAYRPSWSEGMTAGMGWIALAITIFALWHPLRAIFASVLFGAFFHLSFRLQGLVLGFFCQSDAGWQFATLSKQGDASAAICQSSLTFSAEILKLLPYVFTIIALTLTSLSKGKGAFGAPEALGLPYQRSKR